MSLIRINPRPSAAQLRVFAVLWLIFAGVLGAVAWRRGATGLAEALWAAGAAVAVPGLVAPRLVRLVYLGAVYASLPIGLVVSGVLLAAVYFLVLTPIGLIMRLFGHDPLARRFEPGGATYWKPRGATRPAASYFRQM